MGCRWTVMVGRPSVGRRGMTVTGGRRWWTYYSCKSIPDQDEVLIQDGWVMRGRRPVCTLLADDQRGLTGDVR